MKVAVVGATGLVGQKMLQILEERNFPVSTLIPVASQRSHGKTIHFKEEAYLLRSNREAVAARPDVAFFSAGSDVSLEWAPRYQDAGAYVIDNSSAWRMEEGIKLVVPEVNAATLSENDKIIANPNCSTIQLVVVLAPLHEKYGIKRVVISTYQSVTGTGMKAVAQLDNERAGVIGERAYPHPIDLNCLPHGGAFTDNGYTVEEEKLLHETRKIMNAPEIQLTATVVRVPVIGGHSESVNIEFRHDYEQDDLRQLLIKTPGIAIQDEPENNTYPMPIEAKEKDAVFVGRIRRDFSQPRTVNMWIVSDNLRKGAATNTIQIAEYLVEKGWLG